MEIYLNQIPHAPFDKAIGQIPGKYPIHLYMMIHCKQTQAIYLSNMATLKCIKLLLLQYRNCSNFHGTNISRIPKMDSIGNFIFTNPPLYNIHEFVFALIEFNGAWHLQGFRLSSIRAGTKLCLVHLKET